MFVCQLPGIIVYSIAFGIVMAGMGQKARVMLDFFQVLSDISMKMISIIMWYVLLTAR